MSIIKTFFLGYIPFGNEKKENKLLSIWKPFSSFWLIYILVSGLYFVFYILKISSGVNVASGVSPNQTAFLLSGPYFVIFRLKPSQTWWITALDPWRRVLITPSSSFLAWSSSALSVSRHHTVNYHWQCNLF